MLEYVASELAEYWIGEFRTECPSADSPHDTGQALLAKLPPSSYHLFFAWEVSMTDHFRKELERFAQFVAARVVAGCVAESTEKD